MKIWKVKIRVKKERKPIFTIGLEEEQHNLILWRPWVAFSPEQSFFHVRALREKYGFMETLMRIATYFSLMKKDDGTQVYAGTIMGISPYMLGMISGYELHTNMDWLEWLQEKGYLTYTQPTKGVKSEMNIMLNETTTTGHKIFTIQPAWIDANMIADKVEVIGVCEDGKTIKITQESSTNGTDELVASLRDNPSECVPPVLNANMLTDALSGGIVPVDRHDLDPAGWSGQVKDFLQRVSELQGDFYNNTNKKDMPVRSFGSLGFGPQDGKDRLEGGKSAGQKAGINPSQSQHPNRVDMDSLSTWGKVVAMFYETETGLVFTKDDVAPMNEVLKISHQAQIFSAIQTARQWRTKLPAGFGSLPPAEKKRCIIESQPGYYLKKDGMKHIYNFIVKSPRFRKDMRNMKNTGVVSGLNIERARENQKKILDEIRSKKKAGETNVGK